MSGEQDQTINPFALLAVTVRDDAGRIMSAVEDQSLIHDHNECQRAAATLTHPRRRLEAEVAWFPGLNPSSAAKAANVSSLEEVNQLGLRGLAKANALERLLSRGPDLSADDLAELVGETFKADGATDSQRLLVEINEDRHLAGFPAVAGADTIEDEIERRRIDRRQSMLRSLENTPTSLMAEAMCKLAAECEEEGFPRPLHDFFDDYGLRAEPFMAAELARAERLASKARDLAGSRSDALDPLISAFEEMLETWQQLTYPMHQSLSARGQTYEESERMARLVRGLAIELNNKHDLVGQARRLSEILEEAFAASPAIAARIAEDSKALENLETQARQNEQELNYSARIGMFGGNTLSISSSGLEWKNEFYPADMIRKARWGAVRKSVNGVPAGTDYLIAWSDGGRREAVVTFGKGEIFEQAIPRIIKLLITPTLSRMFTALRNGQDLRFGPALVRDEGVMLHKPRFFGSDVVEYPWSEVTISSLNGNLVIAATDNPKTKVEISYRDVGNTHFLEIAIRAIFKNGADRLSNAFD